MPSAERRQADFSDWRSIMAVKRKTIILSVESNTLAATDSDTGEKTTDAGIQGEDGAVWLHIDIPSEWSDLNVRLQVLSSSGSCDESGLPSEGAIDMPLRSIVTVPGKLTVTLTGISADGVRRTAQCDSLFIAESDCPVDVVSESYPVAFEDLYNKVENNVVHAITGSGGALVTKTSATTYNIDVSGTGGDMLAANYASGSGQSNANTVDHALYADTTGTVENAEHATFADSAASAASGSALESALNSKQQTLTNGSGGVELMSGTTLKSLKGDGITISSDDNNVTLGVDGAFFKTGMIAYIAQPTLPAGWQYCDGREVLISDYPKLYSVIGNRFGQGTIDHIRVTSSYFTDNENAADDIILKKYASGIQTADYFETGGTVFTNNYFDQTSAGSFTVYCKDSKGREALQYVHVPSITSAFVLNVTPVSMSEDYRLTLNIKASGESDSVTSMKIASGIQTTSYFADKGTVIGTSNSVNLTFQPGTAYESGIYTFYAEDSYGNSTLQYCNVIADKTLALYLCSNYDSYSFLLPNLSGTLNSLLTACIKL
jgi:hypothetical protein